MVNFKTLKVIAMETYKNCFIAYSSDIIECGNCDCVNRTKIITMDEQCKLIKGECKNLKEIK